MQVETSPSELALTKIKLMYHEKTNSAFVYSVKDWEVLRKRYRIVGEIFGHTQFVSALPLRLNPEEVIFLIKTNKATLIKYSNTNSPPNEHHRKVIGDFHNELVCEEKAIYVNLRKDEINVTSNKIIAGKRKQGDTRSEDVILEEELQKSSAVSEMTMVWPIFTASVEEIQGSTVELPLNSIYKYTTEIKCLVYEDLWQKGFFITSGQKFGSDFLVYSGDPILFHAIYIVKCVEDYNKIMFSSELIAFGRLGTSVKKKAVLASLREDHTVMYIVLNWINSINK